MSVTTKPCHSKEFPDLDQENADCADVRIVLTSTRHAWRSGRFLLATWSQSCSAAWMHSCASAPLPAQDLLPATRTSAMGLE